MGHSDCGKVVGGFSTKSHSKPVAIFEIATEDVSHDHYQIRQLLQITSRVPINKSLRPTDEVIMMK